MGQDARRIAGAAALAIALGQAAPALAQEEDETICGTDRTTLAAEGAPLDMLFGRDDRRQVDAWSAPWRAIGQLVTPYGTCSGTVVDDALVLTAAHCVTDYLAGRITPGQIQFYAGLQDNMYQAAAVAAEVVVAPGYSDRDRPDGDVRDDWAFLLLDREIGDLTGVMPVYDLREADLYYLTQNSWGQVNQAGYGSDLPEGLTGHLDCRIEDYHSAGWVEHNCDVVPGDSGSPLFVERDRGPYVVAVVSGVHCRRNGTVVYNTAADARAFYDTFAELAGGSAVDQGTVSGRMTTPPTNGPRIIRICETGPC